MTLGAFSLLRQQVIIAFRCGELGAANDGLSQLLGELPARVTPELAPQLLPILQAMLAAQERGDGLFLADLLEHSLPTFGEDH